MPEEKILLELTGAEAPVLFESLTRWDQGGKLAFENEAERWALNDLYCLLEAATAEVFSPNYPELLQRARERVRDGREW